MSAGHLQAFGLASSIARRGAAQVAESAIPRDALQTDATHSWVGGENKIGQ